MSNDVVPVTLHLRIKCSLSEKKNIFESVIPLFVFNVFNSIDAHMTTHLHFYESLTKKKSI